MYYYDYSLYGIRKARFVFVTLISGSKDQLIAENIIL